MPVIFEAAIELIFASVTEALARSAVAIDPSAISLDDTEPAPPDDKSSDTTH